MNIRIIIIISFILGSLNSCKVQNLRSKWVSHQCPQHSIKLKKAIVKTEPSGPYLRERDDAIPYCLYDSLPLSDGNAKLINQKPGCLKIPLEFAKIYYCPICNREYIKQKKIKKKEYNKEWVIEKSKLGKGYALLACIDFIENQKYLDSSKISDTYSFSDETNSYKKRGSFSNIPQTKSLAIQLIDTALKFQDIYILKNKYTKDIASDSSKIENKILPRKELQRKGINVYLEIKNIYYPPQKWEENYVVIEYILQPFDIPIFNNIIVQNDSLLVKQYRFKK